MPRIKYEEECKFRGILFKKGEIFYADRIQFEWGWRETRWLVWLLAFVIDILLLGSGRFPICVLTKFLFSSWKESPWKCRFFINEECLWWRCCPRKSFSSELSTALLKKGKIVEVQLFRQKGQVKVYKKGVFSEMSCVGNARDIGKIDDLAVLLKKYGYPFTFMDE